MADLSTGDYGAGLAGTAQSTGENALNKFDPTAAANTVRTTFSDLQTNQAQQGQNYAQQFAGTINNLPKLGDLYSQANQQYGVQPLAQNAARLNSQVANQLPMQQQLMRGFDASQEQVDNATNYNLRFLQPQATQATNEAQAAQQLAGQQVGYGIQQNQMNLLPIQAQGDILKQTLAGQATGFDTAAQQELAGLQAKMTQGVALSTAEYTRANQLLQAQEAYQQALGTQNIQSAATIGAAQAGAGAKLAPNETYYNPFSTTKPYSPGLR